MVQPAQTEKNCLSQLIPVGEPEMAGAPNRILCDDKGSIEDFQMLAAEDGEIEEPPTEESWSGSLKARMCVAGGDCFSTVEGKEEESSVPHCMGTKGMVDGIMLSEEEEEVTGSGA